MPSANEGAAKECRKRESDTGGSGRNPVLLVENRQGITDQTLERPAGGRGWSRRQSRREGRSPFRQERGSEASIVLQLSEAILKGWNTTASNVGVSDARQTVSVAPITSNITAKFDPTSQNVDDWLESVNEYAQIYGWNDGTICHFAINNLGGSAEIWYRCLPSRMFAWSEWKIMLTRNFLLKRNLHQLLHRVMKCVPKATQSLYDYTFQTLALINRLKLNITPEERRPSNLILGGIKNEQICFSVETAAIKDPHVLASHLKTLDGKQINPNTVAQSSAAHKNEG